MTDPEVSVNEDALSDAFRIGQAQGADVIQRALGSAWYRSVNPYNLDATFPGYREAGTRILAVGHAHSAAAARSYYAEARRAAGLSADLPSIAPVVLNAEAAATSLLVTGPVAVKRLTGAGRSVDQASELARLGAMRMAKRVTLNGGRDTLVALAQADPDAHGFARASDGQPCHFCAMLVSRGPVYKGSTVGFKAHDGCGCVPRPFFKGAADGGWTPQAIALRRVWEDDPGWTPTGGRSTDGAPLAAPDFRQAVAEANAKAAAPLPSPSPSSVPAGTSAPAATPAPASSGLTHDKIYERLRAKKTAVPAAEPPTAPSGFLSREQYEAFTPSAKWTQEGRDKITAALRADDNGKALIEALDLFQTGEGQSIPRLRAAIRKRLEGVPVTAAEKRRADAIIDALRHAPTDRVPEKVYRGMHLTGSQADLIAKYKPGDPLDLSLSSFSSSRKVATDFQGGAAAPGRTPVMLELTGSGKRMLPIQNFAKGGRYFDEKEWIGAGRFRIDSVRKTSSGGIVVRITQEAPL